MDKRQLKKPFVPDLSTFSADDLADFDRETRRAAAWNRRAALLRARDAGADPDMIDREVEVLENAFQDDAWMRFGDKASRLQSVTPLSTADEVARLADANNRAAQAVETIALAGQLVDVATTLLNIANGRIPAGAAAVPAAMAAAAPAGSVRRVAARMTTSQSALLLAVLAGVGAGAGMLFAATRVRR